MRHTRGGVLGIGAIDPQQGELSFVGVGNVSGQMLLGDVSTKLFSREGTVGTALEMPRLRLASYPWAAGASLVHRDGERGTDDATVLVVRDEREPVA
jgi:hypothetical protein